MTSAPSDFAGLDTFAFGDSAELADRLLGLVLAGSKRATCWAVSEGQQTIVGKRMAVLDGHGVPRAVLETISLDQRRFCDVDWDFAAAEGEGDTCLDDWRRGHRGYFIRNGQWLGEEMWLWCERFELVKRL